MKRNYPCYGQVKGEPQKFLVGHTGRFRIIWGIPEGVKVDPEDALKFGHLNWSVVNGYVIRAGPNGTSQRLHRLIMDAPEGKMVDHINGDTRDNRKVNLRVVDQMTNRQNITVLNRNNTSGFRNVSWSKQRKKWVVTVYCNYINYRLGSFDSAEEAGAVAKAWRLKNMPGATC